MKQNKGITLIALIVTIIILLILAGITITFMLGDNGILNRAKNAGENYEEQAAREKLEIALADLTVDKLEATSYNENAYIDEKLIKQDMIVNGDIITVNGWQFEIDRSVPKISASFGKTEINNADLKLELNKTETIIGITNQENINIPNTDQIKVITENVSKNQYKWKIEEASIASIDTEGNVTAIKGGNTVIKCTSIDGSKVYATCDLIIEEREYLYYHGKSISEFEEPICGSNGTLTGVPYFREEYIYSNFSNISIPNESQLLNFVTKNKIDFSKYKKIGLNVRQEHIIGTKPRINTKPVQEKTCNMYGLITSTVESFEKINTDSESKYYTINEYNETAYLDIWIRIGEYMSGIVSQVDTYIYEIFLVK